MNGSWNADSRNGANEMRIGGQPQDCVGDGLDSSVGHCRANELEISAMHLADTASRARVVSKAARTNPVKVASSRAGRTSPVSRVVSNADLESKARQTPGLSLIGRLFSSRQAASAS